MAFCDLLRMTVLLAATTRQKAPDWDPKAAAAYLDAVDWEPRESLERRAAALLPGLLLARVDGKSPVEYLSTAAEKDEVRAFARALIVGKRTHSITAPER